METLWWLTGGLVAFPVVVLAWVLLRRRAAPVSREGLGSQAEGTDPPGQERAAGPGRTPRLVALAGIVGLPLIVFGIHVAMERSVSDHSSSALEAHEAGGADVPAMVDGLAARLARDGGTVEDWRMLARSASVLGRREQAVDAFRRALGLSPEDDDLRVDLADALALANDRKLEGEPLRLIGQVLDRNPVHVKALALAGTAAWDAGRVVEAVAYWRKALANPTIAPAFETLLSRNVAQAERAMTRPGQAGPAAKPRAGVSGVVRLAPQLGDMTHPDDPVFIFARAAESAGGMPLAVLRKRVRDLPTPFFLDDNAALNPNVALSDHDRVVVGARISRWGGAERRAGDLEGLSAAVTNAASGVVIVIEKIVR